MKGNIIKIVGSFLTLGLCIAVITSNSMVAEEASVELSREEVGSRVVSNSTVIAGLERSLKSMTVSHGNLKDAMSGLKSVYKMLPQYEALEDAYIAVGSMSGYHDYLTEASKETPDNVVIAALFTANPSLEVQVAEPENMQVSEYKDYLRVKGTFAAVGVNSPNISSSNEYKQFITPIYLTPMSLQVGIANMVIGIEDAKSGTEVGVLALYDGILTLEGYMELQELSYSLEKDDLRSATLKYSEGRLSKNDYETAINDEKIAELNRDIMERNVDNLKMNLNVMLGQDVTTDIILSSESKDVTGLEPVEVYITRALEERNELKTLANNESYKSREAGYIDDYYIPSSEEYKVVQLELNAYEIQKVQLEQQIKQEIYNAYLDILEKQENLVVKENALLDGKRQYSDLELNVELGFVTNSALEGFNIMVTQLISGYEEANREYHTAIEALDNASHSGPAYVLNEGGVTFE